MDDPLSSIDWIAANIARESKLPDAKAREHAEYVFKTLHPTLRAHLAEWWKTEHYDKKLAVEGWTVDSILANETTDCVWGAFTFLSGLITDKENTLELLRRVNRRPDIVEFSPEFREKMRSLLEEDESQ